MKRLTITLLLLMAAATVAFAQAPASNIRKVSLSQPEIDRIVKKFTNNEGLFREALGIYAFSRNATIQTIGMGGQVTGTYRRDSLLTFTSDGNRVEKIEYAPVPTLTEIEVTPSDIDNLGGIDPFAIEPSKVSQYNFSFVGKEKIDDLDLFVFDVTPKVLPEAKKNGPKLFTGRVWVDDRDLMIVKSKGKAVPEAKNERFPVVETWRENVDGKYWFPSYSSSDDDLVFDSGQVVKLRFRVKYTDYKQARTDVKVISEEDVPEEKPAPTPTPKKPE